MSAKLFVPLVVLVGVLYATHHASTARAQQAFLPPMFQLGAKIALDREGGTVYTVLGQQGAWIRVAIEKSGASVAEETEAWIYAPNGTVWRKAR
jgi:hypothetical protein